ncbi:MAG TPA: sigma-70 family RNA polymerase sigma factor [Longimicrobium sp.]|nr:sigma-70 family RNA polymerase sigma factor [Longimicrobium sp.]
MSSGSSEWEQWLESIEHDLRRGAAARDNASWQPLSERVSALASSMLLHEDVWTLDADDLAQDILLRLLSVSTLRRVRASRSPEGYVVVMIRNRIRDEYRRGRWKSANHRDLSEWTEEPWNDGAGEFTLDRRIALERLLGELSEDEWELIRLRFWEDMSISDVAHDIGTSYSAASVRLFRLLKKLRHRLESSERDVE